jgi:hypothetical protein
MDTELKRKDVIELYEDGKHRRYALLFSISGGALAIGKFLAESGANSGIVLGGLSVRLLAILMAVLTAAMCFDIWMFGIRMRSLDNTLFQWPGKIVLLLLALLLALAWILVGFAGR